MDFKERAKRAREKRKPTKVELELHKIMPGILEDLVASLPGMSRKEALEELDFRLTCLSKHKTGKGLFEIDFDTSPLEKACQDLLNAFQKHGMTYTLALGQLVYEVGQAARHA